jgi:hypothetical protein
VVSFEELMLDSGRLAGAHEAASDHLVDVSAGAWRQRWIGAPRDYPAVQPQHERRKYLIGSAHGAARAGSRLLKFVGLGRRGRAAHARAERLADVGFAPRPLALAEGFLALETVNATPLTPGSPTPRLIDRIAQYLAFLERECRVSDACAADTLREIVEVNLGEGLGIDPRPALTRLRDADAAVRDAPAIALDARMLPHEWLRHGDEYLKTDGLDHHDDHFHPGPHDIAWDLAATAEEFGLTPVQLAHLTDRYRTLTGDRTVNRRLPLHRAAYLAFRLGYSTLAAESLAGSEEAARWHREMRRYAARLRCAISSTSRAA